MSLPLIIERTLNAPVALVWKALTDKNEMKKWYFDLADFKPQVGFTFTFDGKADEETSYTHLCEVIEVIPQKKIAYTWRYKNYEGVSLVTFELVPDGNRTHITLTHSGLENFPQNNPHFARHNFLGGWTYFIGEALPKYIGENQ